MKINYTAPNSYVVYLRPNGIDAAYELIDGCDFEPIEYFSSYSLALSESLNMAKRSSLILYDCDSSDTIKAVYDLTRKS